MKQRIAVIGAGVSGLTCGCRLAEHGYETTILADQVGLQTTSGAAGAIWFPYDVEPFQAALIWALESYTVFEQLSRDPNSGVSLIEQRTFCRTGTIAVPEWATKLEGTAISDITVGDDLVRHSNRHNAGQPDASFSDMFSSGFTMRVPLIDTTIYLDYLSARFRAAGGKLTSNHRLENLSDVPPEFSLIVNCAGIGAMTLVPDPGLEPHRGQVVIVPKLDLSCAVVCDDEPLMYAIPRTNDCLFGGTNDVSDNCNPDPAATTAILNECSRVLGISPPQILAERVGLRPFRRTGVRLDRERLGDRNVIHNYGHGGAGFTLSWGCADEVLRLVAAATRAH